MAKTRLLFCLMLFIMSLLPQAEISSQQYITPIGAMDWSEDGNLLAVGYSDGTVEILDTATSEIVRTLNVDTPMSFDWSPGPHFSWLTVTNLEGQILIIDVDSGQTLTTIEDDSDYRIYAIAWSPDESKIATGHAVGSLLTDPGGVVKIWDAGTGELQANYGRYRHVWGVDSLSWSPDGVFLASSSIDGTMLIWNSITSEIVKELDTEGIGLVKWSPDGTQLATLTDIFTLQLWSATTFERLRELRDTAKHGILEFDWRPGTSEIAIATVDAVVIMNTDSGQETYVLPSTAAVLVIAWSPDGGSIAYGGRGGISEITNAPSSNCTATIAAGDVAGLISAIDAANANPDPDTICLAASSTYTLTAVHNTTSGANGLPAITTAITLVGNGATLTRDPAAPAFRLVLVSSSGALTLEDLTLTGGLASAAEPGDDGGGIYNRGTLTLTDSIVTTNTANGDGGGIYNDGTLTLSGTSRIADNSAADDGGGIYITGGVLTVTGGTIPGNSAGDQGGGVRSVTCSVTLTNANLTGNSASSASGGGLYATSTTLADYLNPYHIEQVHGPAPHPQTQGKIERYHRSMKSIVKLTPFFFPWELEQAIADFVAYYNTERYHESLDNVTPADVYLGRQQEVLTQRAIITQPTLTERRRHNLRIEEYIV